MTLVTWQDLCIDALDVNAQARFWAAVSGLVVADAEPPARLAGPTPRHTLWVNPVDRPHDAKNRTHLDVDCASVDGLVALGARVLSPSAESGFGWTVVADPEGNEFCAFERTAARLPDYRLHGIGIDCVDPEMLARWWGRLFGAEPEHDTTYDVWTLTGVAVDERMTLDFAAVPSRARSPTVCTGTSSARSTSSSSAVLPGCGTNANGRCWQTRRATSSASTRRAGVKVIHIGRKFFRLVVASGRICGTEAHSHRSRGGRRDTSDPDRHGDHGRGAEDRRRHESHLHVDHGQGRGAA